MELRFGRLAGTLVAGATVLSLQSSAHANTFTYSSYTVPGEQTIQITSPANVFGGMGQIDLVGAASSAGVNIPAWCLDVYTYLLGNGYGGSGPFTYNITQPLTNAVSNVGFSTDGVTAATLLTSQINDIGGLIAYGDANVGQANVSAATQLAIWEVEYGQAFQFTGVSTATQNLASSEISELGTTIPLDSNVALLTQVAGETNQTLAYEPPAGGGGQQTETPLPGSLPLFITGAGILGIIGGRRRKRAGMALAAV